MRSTHAMRALLIASFTLGATAAAVRCGEDTASTKKTTGDNGAGGNAVEFEIAWQAPSDTDEVHEYRFYAAKSKTATDWVRVHTASAAAAAEGGKDIDTTQPKFKLTTAKHDSIKAYTTGTVCIKVAAVGHGGTESDHSDPVCADN